MSKKKVLFFLPDDMGGAQRMTITIAQFLDEQSFDVRFVVMGNNKDKPVVKNIPQGYKILFLKSNVAHKSKLLVNVSKVLKLIWKEKPNYIFASLCSINLILLLSSLFCRVKCIIRMDNYLDIESSLARILIRILYPLAYRIISQQEDMEEVFRKYVKCKDNQLITIHNPIDKKRIDDRTEKVESPYKDEKDILKFLWVANITYNKGNDILIKAFEKVHNSIPNAHLYFVGTLKNNPFCDMCLNLVKDKGLQDYIHFVGYDDNPYRWMKFCDCFVLPSRIEGLPNVLVEAMYLGRPVVATKCIPFISRIVDDGKNGIICETENPQALANAMIKAVDLKKNKMTYKPSTADDFVKIFN